MLAVPALPDLTVEGPWQVTVETWSRREGRLRVRGAEADADTVVRIERCAAGRLRDAYPVGAHDVELVLEPEQQRARRAPALLRALALAVHAADVRCRKVVYAVEEDDRAGMDRAEAAGFRYVVDTDLQERRLSLLVHEPAWVTHTDMDLDRVPGS
ncbi:hypothetical protein [Streptomyces graminilatus]|uniref:hypothetical protein n=1 Tax=Streptomyces graminilatus TaxID=1464070 RepID=UPI0006E469DD|nr:hypothetical protein [Streptomyces graminilatus]